MQGYWKFNFKNNICSVLLQVETQDTGKTQKNLNQRDLLTTIQISEEQTLNFSLSALVEECARACPLASQMWSWHSRACSIILTGSFQTM